MQEIAEVLADLVPTIKCLIQVLIVYIIFKLL